MMRRAEMAVLLGFVAACDAPARTPLPTAPMAVLSESAHSSIEPARGYSLQLLPSLYLGTYAHAYAINDSGTIVGVGDIGDDLGCYDYFAAIAWTNSVAHNINADIAGRYDLGNPPPGASCADIYSTAVDVNNRGEVVVPTSFFGDNSGWMWSASRGAFRGGAGGRVGGAVAMNNRSELVGYIDNGFELRRAALWSSGALIDIDPREYNSTPFGISDDGDIIGCVQGNIGRWRVGKRATTLPELCGEDFGIGPGLYVRNVGSITRDGVAAFSALRNGVPTALVWRRNTVSDAGWSPGAASDISERGRIVGWAYTAGTTAPRAVTRLRNGSVQWLPTPTANTESRAYGVNTCGDVVGYVYDAKGFQRAALWRADRCDSAGAW